jgi:hypothetical protein
LAANTPLASADIDFLPIPLRDLLCRGSSPPMEIPGQRLGSLKAIERKVVTGLSGERDVARVVPFKHRMGWYRQIDEADRLSSAGLITTIQRSGLFGR